MYLKESLPVYRQGTMILNKMKTLGLNLGVILNYKYIWNNGFLVNLLDAFMGDRIISKQFRF